MLYLYYHITEISLFFAHRKKKTKVQLDSAQNRHKEISVVGLKKRANTGRAQRFFGSSHTLDAHTV